MQDLLEVPSMEVVKLNITDSEIAKMKSDYMGLTINGIEDRAGFKKVYESRQIVKKTRTGVEKHAKDLKEKALAWQRKVNSEKDRIVGELEGIESHLQSEEDKVEAEKERIRKEAEEKEAARIQARIDALAQYGFAIDYTTIMSIDDATFEKVLSNAKSEHEKELAAKAEAERLAAEERARPKAEREELEKLRAKQAEQDRIIQEQQEQINRLKAEAERTRLVDEARVNAEKEQAIEKLWRGRLAQLKNIQWDGQDARAVYGPGELVATYGELISLSEEDFKKVSDGHNADQAKFEEGNKIKAEAAAREAEEKRLSDIEVAKTKAVEEARLKAIADARREQEQKAAAELAAKQEADRQASLRPDKDKLQTFSDMLGGLTLPTVSNPAAQEIANEVQLLLNKIQAHIIKKIKAL